MASYGSCFMVIWTIFKNHLSGVGLRATLHTRLRARDYYNSSTLIGGKGGAGPSLLHTMLKGPTEYYVNARWCKVLHGIKWIMFHGRLDYFRKITSWR